MAWVREPRERDLTGACLGSDIDDFLDDYDDMPLSPEPNNAYEKPTFDDYTEAECRDQSDSWQAWGGKDKPSADNGNTSSWEQVSATVGESGSWQAWGSKEKPSADSGNKSSWEKVSATVELDKWQGRGDRDQLAPNSSEMPTVRAGGWSSWDVEKAQDPNQSTKLTKEFDGLTFNNDEVQKRPTWTSNRPKVESSSGWEKMQDPNQSMKLMKEFDGLTFNSDEVQKRPTWTSNKPEVESSPGWGEDWGKQMQGVKKPDPGWKQNSGNDSSWTAQKPNIDNSGWSKIPEKKEWSAKSPDSVWKESKRNESSWTARKPEVESSFGWQENAEKKASSAKSLESGWKQKPANQGNHAWSTKKPEVDGSSGCNESEGQPWVAQTTGVKSSPGWNENGGNPWAAKTPEVGSSGWNENGGNPWAAKTPEVGSSAGWGGNKGKQGWKSQGWGSSSFADRRGQNNNSPRPPGRSDDRGGWRRAEAFTSEEEKILVDVEPIMNSIRKILRESRYLLEHVLAYIFSLAKVHGRKIIFAFLFSSKSTSLPVNFISEFLIFGHKTELVS